MNTPIESLVIIGGGTAGWMSAAYLAKKFSGSNLRITLIESSSVGTVGVGEATVPSIKLFLSELGIDERDFIQSTNATFKLGIEFEGWRNSTESFFHPFSNYGERIAAVDFSHYWAFARAQGSQSSLDEFNFSTQMARAGKFSLPLTNKGNAELFNFNYAYHFDAVLFARYLSKIAKNMGVTALDSKIESVIKDQESGCVTSVVIAGGAKVSGDFFIDCTGFSGLLIEDCLKTGYEDWSHWLPCDTAIACQTSSIQEPNPYTKSIAMNSGWRWNIPLQNRCGNGYVYASDFIADDEACAELLASLYGEVLTDPRKLSFKTGIRKSSWNKNVFAIGLSSGFLEPLESTSIYLIQYSLTALYENFPAKQYNERLISKVNNIIKTHTENLRDFIILHYCLNERNGIPFWDYCRNMSLPDSLNNRIEEYMGTGHITLGAMDFFKMNSWLSMFSGFNRVPSRYHPKVSVFAYKEVERELANIKLAIAKAVSGINSHGEFMRKNDLFRTEGNN